MIAKKTIRSFIIFDVVIYCLFIFTENFSWSMIVFGLLAQLVHNLILRNFPFVKFLSIEFLLAIVILLINHYFAFNYFQENFYSISEVSSFYNFFISTLLLKLERFSGVGLFYTLSMASPILFIRVS